MKKEQEKMKFSNKKLQKKLKNKKKIKKTLHEVKKHNEITNLVIREIEQILVKILQV